MGSLSALRLSFANPAIRTEQPATKKIKQSSFGQGVMGVRYCGGLLLASATAVGTPCSHRQGSPDFVVSSESMASVGIVLQDLPRAMASVPVSMAAAIDGFSLLLLLAYFLRGAAGRRQGKNSDLRPLPSKFGDPCVWVHFKDRRLEERRRAESGGMVMQAVE